jgi:hypothetical protein
MTAPVITPGRDYRCDVPGAPGTLYRVERLGHDGRTGQENVSYRGLDGGDAGKSYTCSPWDFHLKFTPLEPDAPPANGHANGHAPPPSPAEAPPAPAWARQAARELGEPVVVVPGPHPGMESTGHIPFAVALRLSSAEQRAAGVVIHPAEED